MSGNSSNTTVPQFIDTFCDISSFAISNPKLSLASFTPCFTEIVILGSVHIVMILMGSMRLSQLCIIGRKHPKRLANRSLQYFKCFCAVIECLYVRRRRGMMLGAGCRVVLY